MTTLIDLNVPESPCEIKKVSCVAFGLFNPEQIRKLAVCKITNPNLYTDGVPTDGGLHDLRMGTTDFKSLCKTCNMDYRICPGHFGYIELRKPVYNYGFLNVVLCILRCICYSCGHILAHPDDKRFIKACRIKNPQTRLMKIAAIAKTQSICPMTVAKDGTAIGCNAVQPTYQKDNIEIQINFTKKNNDSKKQIECDTKRQFTAEEVNKVLRKISEKDAILLGFNPKIAMPHWLLIHSLLVLPPCNRPPVQYSADRSEDDLTTKLNDIIIINKQLEKFELEGAASHVIADTHNLLQYHIATFMNNEIPGLPVATTRGKKSIKSIRERLKGKEGRLRGNLMGKRVDFSARTVITGDPNIGVDQIGVPYSIAMHLTFSEYVTNTNIEELKRAVANGPNKWPGAKYITRLDGVRFDLRHCASSLSNLQLEPGTKVERHLKDGDYILFNRQPSLHKMSIMGHRIKVLPYSTFRLNLSVTSPYNADFDGDEMNLHVPQSHETRSEIKHLCLLPHQIVSPQSNKPVIGVVQDSLLGLARMTAKNTFIDEKLLMSLCMFIDNWDGILPSPAILKPKKYWTGKQVFSLILLAGSHSQNTSNIIQLSHSIVASSKHIEIECENNIKLQGDNPYFTTNDGYVIMQEGELLSGIIDKRTAGSSAGGLIHVLWHQCGSDKTKDFLFVAQRVSNNWLLTQGFTVGISDIVITDAVHQKVQAILKESNEKVIELIEAARQGKLETQPGKGLLESFEFRVNSELNQAREISGKIAADVLNYKNNIMAMVESGSKGSTINISQIMACVGQQNVEGKRIAFGFNERTLPHFSKYDFSPPSRGFVSSSYLSGLQPHELFFHAMGGREGIIDTACKTSETGYIQRRLVKALEDAMVEYDLTLRNSNGEIIQFLYGEDGMRGEYIEAQTLSIMNYDLITLENNFKHNYKSSNYGEGWLSKDIANEIRYSVDNSVLDQEYEYLKLSQKRLCTEIFPDGQSRQFLPVNIERLIAIAKSMFGTEQINTINPKEIVLKVDHMLDTLKILNTDNKIIEVARTNAITLFAIHCKTCLNSLKLLKHHKLTLQGIDWVINEVSKGYHRTIAQAGEVTGAIAAQSIGEPATQMTLNTFHFAGVGSKNVTLGVPRLRELINAVKDIATPSLTIYLDDSITFNSTFVKEIQSKIEYTSLSRFIDTMQLIYDPEPLNSVITEDNDWINDYFMLNEIDGGYHENMSPWVIRIMLHDRLITEGLTLSDIGNKIKEELSDTAVNVIWTDDNNDQLIIRIRPQLRAAKMMPEATNYTEEDVASIETYELLRYIMQNIITEIKLKGISNIHKVYMREEKFAEYDHETGKMNIKKGRWVLDTDGINLREVLPIDKVNFTKTTSNNIREILDVLGIEAARASLLYNIRTVISFDGSYVNYRHLAALCDIMTQKGTIMPITRNGINRVDKGVLAKCSFEETVEILMQASAFGQVDYLKGVTENIIFGQLGQFGTGLCDIMIDDTKLKDPSNKFEENYKPATLDLVDVNSINALPPESASNFNQVPFSPFSPMSNISETILSPNVVSSMSPLQGILSPLQQAFSPTSPFLQSPFAGISQLNPASPIYSPNSSLKSPMMNIMSPNKYYSPSSPLSPLYSPTGNINMASPNYSPLSPAFGANTILSPKPDAKQTYSPTSPLSPMMSSPINNANALLSPLANPASPSYSKKTIYSPTNVQSLSFFGMNFQNAQSPGAYSPSMQYYSPTAVITSPTEKIEQDANLNDITSPRYDPLSNFEYDEFDNEEN